MKSKIFAVATFAFAAAFAFTAAAATAMPMGGVTVKAGSPSAYVMGLQSNLNTCAMANPVLVADGKYGAKTTAAVAAFQVANGGLTVDGHAGPLTQAALIAKCSGATTPTTPGDTVLNGGAGDATVSETSTDVESTVNEGASNTKVNGFKIEASGSDVSLTALKVTLEADGASGSSYRLNHYINSVNVVEGSKKVGSSDASDFVKNGNLYTKTISLSNAVVKDGSSHKQTFYVTVDAIDSIDSNDFAGTWTLSVDTIRFNDATGAILSLNSGDYSTGDGQTMFQFSSLAASGDVKVVVSKDASSPIAQDVTVSSSTSTKNVLLLAFKVKATGSDVSFDSLNITDSSSGTITDVIGELQLKNGSDVLATIDGASLAGTDTFALDDTFTVNADSTETFKIYATVNDSDNFTSGDDTQVNFASFSPEDSNGDTITDTGSATGSAQAFVVDVPTITKVGSPTLALYTHTDGTTSGLEDSYKATIKFKITAPDSNPVYVPLDTFSYGTAGTAGVQYTLTGGATVTSAAVQYSGDGDLSGITESHTYRIDAGSSEEFTLNVFLTGNDANAKVAMTGLWYEISDATPNGTPAISGLSNIYTPLVPLAK